MPQKDRHVTKPSPLLLDRCLRRCKPGNRHPERRAAHIVEPLLEAEFDGSRIAALLAADSDLQVAAGRTALLDRRLDELTDTGLINRLERISIEDALLEVVSEEPADVVAAEAVRHLRQVIRSK